MATLLFDTFLKNCRTKDGSYNLIKILNTPGVKFNTIKMGCSVKYTLTLPNGVVLFAKKLKSDYDASAETVVSKLHQELGLVSPDCIILNNNNKYLSATTDVLPPKTTKTALDFLSSLCANPLHPLADIYNYSGESSKYLKYFEKDALKETANYYALAIATGNWDGNLTNLNFSFEDSTYSKASGIICIDFEKCFDDLFWFPEPLYSNPFTEKRLPLKEFVALYKRLLEQQTIITKSELNSFLVKGSKKVEDIVREEKSDGFNPNPEFVSKLKDRMDSTIQWLE